MADHQFGLGQPGGVCWQLVELDHQALLQIPAGHARRVKLLDSLEYTGHFIELNLKAMVINQAAHNLFQGGRQITIRLNGINNRQSDDPVGVGHWRQVELPL